MDDLLPDLPILEQLPYTYDTKLLPFNDDIDGLQGHDEAQSEIEEGISQVLAQPFGNPKSAAPYVISSPSGCNSENIIVGYIRNMHSNYRLR